MKKTWMIITILVFSMYMVQSFALNIEVQTPVLKPAESGGIFVTLINTENTEIKDISVNLITPSNFLVNTQNPVYISSLSKGETTTVYFYVSVPRGVEERDYRFEVDVTYKRDYTEETKEKIFYVTVMGTPDFYVIPENTTLAPEKEKSVKLIVANKGTGKGKECSLYLFPSKGLSPVGGGKYYIGDILPGEERNVLVKIYSPEVPEGVYPLFGEIVCTGGGEIYKQNVTLSFFVEGSPDLGFSNVLTTPNEIRPGDRYVRIYTMVFNSGEETAKNVKIYLETKFPFEDSWSNCNSVFVGMLRPGEARRVVFVVNVNKHAKARKYEIPVKITWKGPKSKEHMKTENITIEVKPRPVFEVKAITTELFTGRTGEIKIQVKNIGEEKAEDVKVTAIKSTYQPFEYIKKTDTIGELSPGENGTAVLKISVDKDAVEKEYSITLQIRAIGDREAGDNNVYVINKAIKVRVIKEKETHKRIVLVTCLFILGVGIAGWWKRRKRKQKQRK